MTQNTILCANDQILSMGASNTNSRNFQNIENEYVVDNLCTDRCRKNDAKGNRKQVTANLCMHP